ncbi:hypothetical protein GQ53DRAFT_805838 [Thozetella sp. PMI_491]|nr:hypothetical protein GQ53DRAFT_805838 [Thozetella sp. PMI_491]
MVDETEEWLGFAQTLLANGFAPLHAVAFLLLDLVLPSWVVNIYMVGSHVLLFYGWIVKPKREGWYSTRLLVVFVAWYIVIFVALWVYTSPHKRLLAYHGLTQILPTFLVRTWEYSKLDGPGENGEELNWAVAREALILYSACAYVFTHPGVWWWAFALASSALLGFLLRGRWQLFDALFPLLQQSLWAEASVELITRRVPFHSPMVRGLLFLACISIIRRHGKWDRMRVLEALFMARLPEYVMHSWSRRRQTQLWRQATPKFEYRPLRDGEIRLLVLHRPRWFFGIVEASIVHRPIDLSPDFEAVSYRWGSLDRPEEILLDGCRFAVTSSAFDLLLARRSIWRDRIIWIDAICINQNDDDEKSAQVQLMREIYHRAARVILYTGRDWRARYVVPLMFEIVLAQIRYGVDACKSEEVFPLEEKAPRWRALYDFVSNLYFTRIWVVQEIAVGRKVELYYGGHYIDWTSLLQVFQAFLGPSRSSRFWSYGTSESQIWLPPHTVESFEIMCLLRPDYEKGFGPDDANMNQRNWETMLFATSKFHATDPRDMIFGLIGIVPDVQGEERLRPNYKKTVEQVYEDATKVAMFRTDGPSSIHLLALAGIGFSKSRLPLPSWVPDFSESRPGVSYTYLLAPKRRFFASGESLPSVAAGPGPNLLTVQGIVIDKVLALNASGPYVVDAEFGAIVAASRPQRDTLRFYQSAIDLCEEHATKWPGEDVLRERLWYVLIAGYMNYNPADPRFKHVFHTWVRLVQIERGVQDPAESSSLESDALKEEISSYVRDGSFASYHDALYGAAYGRRFGITTAGRLCLLPPFTEAGDTIFIPFGSQTPFAIRKSNHNTESSFIEWKIVVSMDKKNYNLREKFLEVMFAFSTRAAMPYKT